MEAKLIKDHDNYHLVNDKQFVIGTTDKGILSCTDKMKLSLKNCQAIELGYDLDELINNILPKNGTTGNISERIGFFKGFQKALSILGDKKFSEEDMKLSYRANEDGWVSFQYFMEDFPIQTEWDVEIVMGDPIGISDKYTPDTKPKLDADGCIILKRK